MKTCFKTIFSTAALALLVGTMPVSAQKTNSIETYVGLKATTYETLKRSVD